MAVQIYGPNQTAGVAVVTSGKSAPKSDGTLSYAQLVATQPGPGGASTGSASQVAASATAVTVLAANADRTGASFYYDGAAILYLILSSTTPTSSVFTVKMGVGYYTYYEVPAGYTGIIRGIWSAATGSADVMEFTA